MVNRAATQQLMRKVRRYPVPNSQKWSATQGYNDVSIRTARGVFERRVDLTPGSPAYPLQASELDEKFLSCSSAVLGEVRAARVLHLCRYLHEDDAFHALVAQLHI